MSNIEYFNPFPGLRSFEEEEEYLFFGREKQIDELIHKLSKTRFLAVVGASGSGKSSLVKSGLLPSLHSGFLATAGSGWRICTLKPGNDPIGNLSVALSSTEIIGEDEDNHKTPSIIESILRRSDQGIGEAIKQLSDSHTQNILIVVDQFEELFRFSKYEKSESKGTRDSVVFINLLMAVSKFSDKPIYVVFTMRSDFLGDCTEFRGLPEAINEGQYLIPRMTREERKAAITGPIAVGGAEISQPLLTRLLNDVGDNPDQLPILQHALMRTWDYWYNINKPDEPVGLEHYEAIGTMSKALSMHAEEAYNEIGDDNGKEICEKLFKSLTEKRDDGRGIRHPGIIKDICELAETDIKELTRIIDIFRMPGRSFLMPPAGTEITEETVIDISHESLMRVWDRLITWVQEEIESAELYTRLAQSAELYQEGKTGLWRDPELLMAINWQTNQNPNEVWAKRYDPSFDRAITFLEYSVAEKKRETKNAEKKRKAAIIRLRFFIFFVSLACAVAVVFAYKSIINEDLAKTQKENAEKAQKSSDSLSIIAQGERDLANLRREEASKAKERADSSAKIAKESAAYAKIQEQKAMSALTVAQRATLRANDSAESAKNERAIAKQKADEATKQAENARKAEKNADRLRLLAEAKNIAIKSVQIINDPSKDALSLQLAIFSYGINRFLNGNKPDQNQIIYDALKSQLTKSYKTIYQDRKDRKITPSKYDERAITFISNSEFITTGDDGDLKKWKISGNPNIISSQMPFVINEAQSRHFSNLAISPDNNLIIAKTIQGNLVAWFLSGKSSKPIQLFTQKGMCNFIYFIPSKDNNYSLLANFGNEVYIIKIDKNNLKTTEEKLISKLEFGKIKSSVIFTQNNIASVVMCNDKILQKLSIKNDKDGYKLLESEQLPLTINFKGSETITSLAVSTSGQFLAIGGSKGAINVFNLKSSKNIRRFEGNISSITSLCFSSKDSDSLLVSGSFYQSIHINKFSDTKVEGLILKESNAWIRSLALSPDNKFIVAIGRGGLIQIWPTSLEVLLGEIARLPKDKSPIDKPIDKDMLKDEIGNSLYKSLEELDSKNSGIDKLWDSFINKYIK